MFRGRGSTGISEIGILGMHLHQEATPSTHGKSSKRPKKVSISKVVAVEGNPVDSRGVPEMVLPQGEGGRLHQESDWEIQNGR